MGCFTEMSAQVVTQKEKMRSIAKRELIETTDWDRIKKEIKDEFIEFTKKGEFEKTEEYQENAIYKRSYRNDCSRSICKIGSLL